MMAFSFGQWHFKAYWLPSLVAFLLLALFLRLGIWQLDRASTKTQILERYAERTSSNAHPNARLKDIIQYGKDAQDFKVTISGTAITQFNFLLDNRIHQGRAGFHVLTPVDIGEAFVLVNRGWIPWEMDRRKLPRIPDWPQDIHITGLSHIPNPKTLTRADDDYLNPSWPFVIQKIELDKAQTFFEKPLLPLVVKELDSEDNGSTKTGSFKTGLLKKKDVLVRDWTPKFMPPEKHHGYAFQWFALAFTLCIIFCSLSFTRKNREMYAHEKN